MTEDEAKTKWCPHAVVDNRPMTAGVNRWAVPGSTGEGKMKGTNCLGSGCMAWRWLNEVTGRGYCGLAGVVNS